MFVYDLSTYSGSSNVLSMLIEEEQAVRRTASKAMGLRCKNRTGDSVRQMIDYYLVVYFNRRNSSIVQILLEELAKQGRPVFRGGLRFLPF